MRAKLMGQKRREVGWRVADKELRQLGNKISFRCHTDFVDGALVEESGWRRVSRRGKGSEELRLAGEAML
jgi:hypothetical protein